MLQDGGGMWFFGREFPTQLDNSFPSRCVNASESPLHYHRVQKFLTNHIAYLLQNGIFITDGIFRFSIFDRLLRSLIEIFFNLLAVVSDASDSDELQICSALTAHSLGTLAVALTFAVLVEACDAPTLGASHVQHGLCGGGIAPSTASSSVRFPLGFAAVANLGVAFAGIFRVGALPF